MADADPDAARERQVPRRDRRGAEPQGCPSGPRYEPMDGCHGTQGLRVLSPTERRKSSALPAFPTPTSMRRRTRRETSLARSPSSGRVWDIVCTESAREVLL